jgi:hypothetical protein
MVVTGLCNPSLTFSRRRKNMKIRLRQTMLGLFHGHLDAKRGTVVEVDEANALRYINSGYADPVRDGQVTVERAVAPQAEKAVIDVPPSSIPPHPADDKGPEEEKPKPKPLDDEPAAARPAPAPRPQGRPGQRR